MKLIMVRHGEAFEGDLTVKGIKQVEAVADKLAERKLEAIYCSNAKRCEQTLNEILEIRNDDMPVYFSSLVGSKMKSERMEELKTRVELFIDDLKYDFEDSDTVLLVSHLAVIRMINFLVNKVDRQVKHGEIVEISIFCPAEKA